MTKILTEALAWAREITLELADRRSRDETVQIVYGMTYERVRRDGWPREMTEDQLYQDVRDVVEETWDAARPAAS